MIMKQLLSMVSLLFVGFLAKAQDISFKAIASKTTVGINSRFSVEFKVENAQANDFEAPDFKDFVVVGGPSTNSSVTIINGKMSQTMSYVYYLQAKTKGSFAIKSAKVILNDKEYKTDKIKIEVTDATEEEEIQEVPTPQKPDPWGSFFERHTPSQSAPSQQTPPRKNRKKYQI